MSMILDKLEELERVLNEARKLNKEIIKKDKEDEIKRTLEKNE